MAYEPRPVPPMGDDEIKSWLAAIVESSEDAIISKTLDGIIRSWNQGAERIFGYSADEAVGRPITMLIPPDRREEEARILAQLSRGERVDHFETVRVTKDGRQLAISLTISPIRDASGRVVGASKIARDITRQRQIEQELRQAKEAAEDANRTKDLFLAFLSHELRTPLTPSLLAAASLAADLPEGTREDAELIRRNIELTTHLIDDLLDLSRINYGKLELRLEPVDAHELIRRAADLVRPGAMEKRLRLAFDLNASHRILHGDATKLQQVFANLLKNAVKFTPPEGVVTVESNESPAGFLTVTVADTGIGIDSETLPHLFDPFRQGSRVIARQYGGLGLGLALVKGFVEAHGGTIRAQSGGKGKGAIFQVRLPLASEPAIARPSAPPEPAATRALRILLVEDHEDTLRLMTRLLTKRGHKVVPAASVKAAMAAAESQPLDLLLCDLDLPDGSGIDLIRGIRAICPVAGIALTGYSSEADIQRTREAGFSAHLIKPLDVASLEAAIDRVSRRTQGKLAMAGR